MSAASGKEVKITNAAIAIFFQMEVYLVKLNGGKGWSFPGGVIDWGEISYDAAFREFDEETGTNGLKKWVQQNNQQVTKCMYGQKKYHTDIYVIQCQNRKLIK